MELIDALRARRSIRAFDDVPVGRDLINELIDAATLAPSTRNIQPWHFHVATGATRVAVGEVISLTTQYLQEYIDTLGEEGVERAARFYADLGNAPVAIAVSLPDVSDAELQTNVLISAGAAVQNLLLRAVDLGLGACSITAPHWVVDRLAEVFSVPAGRRIASLVIVGRPNEVPAPHERRSDVVSYLD